MAPIVVSNRRNKNANTARQKLAQVLREFIEGRGGWIISPLPLADNVPLSFDVRSRDAAPMCNELGALGLAVRFVTAGLKAEPGAITALIREGDGFAIGRRMPAPCAVTTLEIALPDQNVARQCDGEIIRGCGAATAEATDTARRTTRVRIEATVRAPMRCSRAKRHPFALRQAGQF
jgi:hypothetical protein